MKKYAIEIMRQLENHGFDAYMVGGCVRDHFLGTDCNDIDIATSATVDQVMSIFPDAIPTGIDFGTVTVIMNSIPFEITTFRKDGEYTDSRRPDEVFYTSSITDDLARRDFTINAMAESVDGSITDPFMGLDDLKNGIIQCVGDPDLRFSEDALRMMRAVRFAARFDFTIEKNTFNSIKKFAHAIQKISPERINQELTKILLSKNPGMGVQLLHNTGLLQHIMPEFLPCIDFNQHNPHHRYDVFTHTIHVLDNVPAKLYLRLAALFHDVAKPQTFTTGKDGTGHFFGHEEVGVAIAEKTLKKLRFDNTTIDKTIILIKNHMVNPDIKPTKLLNKVGKELVFDLITLLKADIIAGSNDQKELKKINELKNAVTQAIESKQATEIKDLAINGNDLMALGVKKGKNVGTILKMLLDFVLENPESNDKNTLLKLAVEFNTNLSS